VTSAAWRALASARWLAWALAAAVGVLPLLPVLAALWPELEPLARSFEPWFGLHCHRDPARTLSVGAVPLAVCARCSGIYFGVSLGALVRRPRLSPRKLRWSVTVAALFMLLDVVLEQQAVHGPWTGLRLATGLLLAYPVGVGLGEACFARAPVDDQSP
jgi:uncharacterized membrane protein